MSEPETTPARPTPASAPTDLPGLYGGVTGRRVRPSDLQRAKDRGERWAMLTSYDMLTAAIFEAADIPVLLVGDSAGNNVLGHPTTVPVTVEELLPMVRAVVRSTSRPMVVADLPFGTYQASPEQALATAVRFLQSGGAHAVKLEGGRRVAAQVELLVSAGVPVTVDELLPLVRAVVRSTTRPLVVADLPFGSYQASPEQALGTAVRFLKEGGAHAVKLEGGVRVAAHVELLVQSGVAVMGHVGLTPQSELVMGRRVQGRGESAQALVDDALALEAAGAFSVVLEGVPASLAERVTKELTVPTIGIGAGAACDAQVLVWTDMAGLTPGAPLTFVKRYADLRGALADAVRSYADEVRDGVFPGPEHSFGD